MTDPQNQKRKEAYREAVNANGLNKAVLTGLHQTTENTVDKWLYSQKRYPSFLACCELYAYLRIIKGDIPNDLFTLFQSPRRTAQAFVKSQKKRKRTGGRPQKVYIFDGKEMAVSEIAKELGLPRKTTYGRIYAAKYTNIDKPDVSDIRHRKKVGVTIDVEQARALRKQGMSYEQIAEKLGVTRHTVYFRLNYKKISHVREG